jgi:hypothetical protein
MGGEQAAARQLCPRRDAELQEHLAQVVLDGTRADEQKGGDLGVGQSLARERGDLRLLRGERPTFGGHLTHLRISRRPEFTRGAVGERPGADGQEAPVCLAQSANGVLAAPLTAQPLTEHELRACQLRAAAGVAQMRE